ncbi:MAG TPA: ribosome maturation factor RimP [Streptosporangiaceae bacterium]
MDEKEVVMRAESGYGSSRPGRARGAGAPAAPRPASRHDLDPAKLEALLEPIVRAAGLDLESVRVGSAGRRRLLRVVVDADGGVSLDDIALVSREASVRLDDTGAMGEAPYTLEVSSPGVDRPLTQPRHWRRAVGRLVRVPLAAPGGPGPHAEAQAAPVEGRIIAAGDNGIILEVDGERLELGHAQLGPGRVQVEFGRPAADPGGQDAARAGTAAGPRTGERADGH